MPVPAPDFQIKKSGPLSGWDRILEEPPYPLLLSIRKETVEEGSLIYIFRAIRQLFDYNHQDGNGRRVDTGNS